MRLPVADRKAVRQATVELMTRERRAAGLVLLLHSLAALGGLAAPWLLGRVVDAVGGHQPASTVDRFAVAIGGCVLAQGLLMRFAVYLSLRLGERSIAQMREEFVRRVLELPVSFSSLARTPPSHTRCSVQRSSGRSAAARS